MPEWKQEIQRHLAAARLSPTHETAIIEELSLHLEDRYNELLSAGVHDEEARRIVLSGLVGIELLSRELDKVEQLPLYEPVVGGSRSRKMIEDIQQDIKYGFRMLAKKPAFTFIAILTLAMGIGANTVIFSAVNSLLIRPLPLPDLPRLGFALALREGYDPSLDGLVEYDAYRQRSHSFVNMGVSTESLFNLTGRGEPERITGASVDSAYLSTLGVNPVVGRGLSPEDDKPGGAAVALIGYGLWQRRYGGDPNINTKSIDLDGQSYAIVGVMPPDFDLPDRAEIWVPMQINIQSLPIDQRMSHVYEIVVRLRPDVSVQQADAELRAISRQLEEEYPQKRRGWTARLIGLRQELIYDFDGKIHKSLYALLGAVAFLLLICCANVASLLLARGVAREHEIAVRRSLGAGWSQIARQLLTESMILALLGGLAGLVLAYFALPFLGSLSPVQTASFSTYLNHIPIDWRVAIFTLLLTLLTGFLFGLIPALKMSRSNELMPLIKQGDQRSVGSASSRRLLNGLIIAEMAIAIALLAGGWLMVQSFQRLQHIDLGFRTDNRLVMQMALSRSKYPQQLQRVAFIKQVLDRVKVLPGVVSTGVSTETPLGFRAGDTTFSVEGRPPVNPNEVPITSTRLVTSDYLKTLGVTLVKGRLIDEHDTVDSAPVVVISEELARQSWPAEVDPIGKHVKRGRLEDTNFPWLTVVGVIKNVKEDRFNFRINRPVWYLSYEQQQSDHPIDILIEGVSDVTSLTASVQSAIHSVDPDQPITNVTTMKSVVAATVVTERFSAVLMASLAVLGLALAAIGLYGMIAYSVGQRKGELGLRIALGATGRDVLWLVIRQGMTPVLIGTGLGLVASTGLSLIINSLAVSGGSDLLFGVKLFDPATYMGVATFLMIVALFAIYSPARRASRTDPMVALRYE